MGNPGYVVVIGAANIDIQGFSFNKLVMEDSNPGIIKISSGGVGRNIAENLSRLGSQVKFLSVLGGDPYSSKLIDECKKSNIDTSDILILGDRSSPVYLSILDDNRDMKLALCDAEILELINIDYIESKKSIIEGACIILLDTNLPSKIIEYTARSFSHKLLYVDTVSTQKSVKIESSISCFDTIKCNLLEAESLSGIKVNNPDDLKKLSSYLTSNGVKNYFITLGKNGVYYGNIFYSKTLSIPKIDVVNTTGAGDAFMAAVIHSRLNDFDLDFTARFSTAASILALYHENTINPNMSVKNVSKLLEELNL